MTIYNDAEARIRARVAEVEALARKLYPEYAAFPVPMIEFYYKGGAAGQCDYKNNRYRFNIGQAVQSDAIERLTVPHEVAHMVAYRVYRISGHKRTWKIICIALGGDGKRCYNAEERGVTVIPARKRVNVREYKYITDEGYIVWLGATRHNRLQRLGDQLHPINGRPMYALRLKIGGAIEKHAFSGEVRIKG